MWHELIRAPIKQADRESRNYYSGGNVASGLDPLLMAITESFIGCDTIPMQTD
jgi:hypothetical protein